MDGDALRSAKCLLPRGRLKSLLVRYCCGLRSQDLRSQGLRLRPVGLDAGRNRAGLRSFGCGRFAWERRGEEILPSYQDDGGKRDSIEDIVLVVHRKVPFPSSKCGLRRKRLATVNRASQFCSYINGLSDIQVCRGSFSLERAGWVERLVRRSSQSEGGRRKRYPSIAFYEDDGFRRLNPSYGRVVICPWTSRFSQ